MTAHERMAAPPRDLSDNLDRGNGRCGSGAAVKPGGKPAKKRRKPVSVGSKTLAECRKRGWNAQNVEQTIRIPGGRTFKRDLFGVIDIVALNGNQTIGIQATATSAHHAHRMDKAFAEPRLRAWLVAGNKFFVWSWSMQGARGETKRWKLREEEISLERYDLAQTGNLDSDLKRKDVAA